MSLAGAAGAKQTGSCQAKHAAHVRLVVVYAQACAAWGRSHAVRESCVLPRHINSRKPHLDPQYARGDVSTALLTSTLAA